MGAVASCLYVVPSESENIELFGCAEEEERPRGLSERERRKLERAVYGTSEAADGDWDSESEAEAESGSKSTSTSKSTPTSKSTSTSKSKAADKSVHTTTFGRARRVWVPSPGRGRSGIGLRTCKEQGEWAELVFMARVRQLGLVVLHPYGDSLTYDLGIEQRGRLLRVHVKSTTFQRGETYEINLTGPGGRRYKKGDLDMFAVYVAPVDVWYILPFELMEGRGTGLQVTPGRVGERYAEYLEAWGLLRGWWK